jgi:hypothetical protein
LRRIDGGREARGDQLRRGAGEILAGVRRRGGDDEADKWGPRGSDRGKGVAPGLRKLEEEVASGNYSKAAQAGMGWRACAARGRRGCRGGWLS